MTDKKVMNKKRTSIYIDYELFKQIKLLSIERDLKVNDLIIAAIQQYLEKNKDLLP